MTRSAAWVRVAVLCVGAAVLAVAPGCKSVASRGQARAAHSVLPYQAELRFPSETLSRRYRARVAIGGPVLIVNIPIGRSLEQYARDYLGTAFPSGPPIAVTVSLDDFNVRDARAHIDASFSVQRGERVVFEKSYQSSGKRYFEQVESVSEMDVQTAILRSADEATRRLFEHFVSDAQAEHATW